MAVALCQQTFPFLGLITGEGVHLRAGPGRSYEVLLRLPRGTKLHVLEQRGTWYAVSLPEGIPAYVHRSYLDQTEEGWGQVKGQRVQVRVHPSDEATSWGAVSAPERVRVLGSHADWVRIQPLPFCRGWVHADFVTFLQTEEGNATKGVSS